MVRSHLHTDLKDLYLNSIFFEQSFGNKAQLLKPSTNSDRDNSRFESADIKEGPNLPAYKNKLIYAKKLSEAVTGLSEALSYSYQLDKSSDDETVFKKECVTQFGEIIENLGEFLQYLVKVSRLDLADKCYEPIKNLIDNDDAQFKGALKSLLDIASESFSNFTTPNFVSPDGRTIRSNQKAGQLIQLAKLLKELGKKAFREIQDEKVDLVFNRLEEFASKFKGALEHMLKGLAEVFDNEINSERDNLPKSWLKEHPVAI